MYRVLADLYADRPYPGEPVFVHDSGLSTLENIKKYLQQPEAELTQLPSIGDQENFTLKGVMGSVVEFSIRPYGPGRFMFGWKHEYYMQDRSWQYVMRDVCGAYSSGFH